MDTVREQEIRRAALHEAVEFTKPLGGSAPEDLIYVADVFAAYITGGPEAALQLHFTRSPEPRAVELRETPPSAPPPAPAPAPEVAPDTRARVARDRTQPTQEPRPATPRPANPEALRKIERGRREAAQQILRQAKVAKLEEHRRRLHRDAVDRGLAEVELEIDGRMRQLGPYLATLYSLNS